MMDDHRPVRATLSWQLDGQQEVLLREDDTAELGRDAASDILLDASYISRRHAVITWREGGFHIQDLGSLNGTRINDRRIKQPHLLQDGDRIKFHDLELLFSTVKEEAPPPPKPNVTQTMIVERTAPQPSLIISSGPQEGRKIVLRRGVMTIGRATAQTESWDIAIADRAISRPHAQIEGGAGGFTLTDLGSVNGTLLNSEPLTAPAALQDGDVIALGETVMIFRTG